MMPDPIRLHRQANTRPGPFLRLVDADSAYEDECGPADEAKFGILSALVALVWCWLFAPERPVVTLAAKLLVAAVWVACVGYCIAIWVGAA